MGNPVVMLHLLDILYYNFGRNLHFVFIVHAFIAELHL